MRGQLGDGDRTQGISHFRQELYTEFYPNLMSSVFAKNIIVSVA